MGSICIMLARQEQCTQQNGLKPPQKVQKKETSKLAVAVLGSLGYSGLFNPYLVEHIRDSVADVQFQDFMDYLEWSRNDFDSWYKRPGNEAAWLRKTREIADAFADGGALVSRAAVPSS
eukprot:TRINITY_DN31217_c0_g2_i2.p1 TRINITY_DN31217_c0_g2~~TRINITY_DN31217_c0_g2_i2.p1  ORF type:complete len:119 (+),score=5.91 TRINITY_DN31217_c0_g2_i2:57-413(+)